MRDFRFSFFVTFICLGLAAWWGAGRPGGMIEALTLCVILGIMEVSLSFDNAVVNATVLKEMSEKWRQLFLTVGILIAVFGMRFFFPIAIVAAATGLGLGDVVTMALNEPDEYARQLTAHHITVAAFGGMFLLMVFLKFIFDESREHHWLGKVEELLARMGKMEAISITVALLVLITAQSFLPEQQRYEALIAGVTGVTLFVLVDSLSSLFSTKNDDVNIAGAVARNGFMGFMYLEILDASFSFDGVIGAFAITKDVVIIMLGLAIGAMFVRSMTVFLVHKGTLDEYIYLEHGAHYAIGVLAFIMLTTMVVHVPELVTGLSGVAFILLSLWSSLRYKKQQALTA